MTRAEISLVSPPARCVLLKSARLSPVVRRRLRRGDAQRAHATADAAHPHRYPRFLSHLHVGLIRFLVILALLFGAPAGHAAEQTTTKAFAIEAGEAGKALNLFTQQSGLDLLYSADAVRGVTTHAVRGRFAPEDALDRLLAGTVLRATKGSRTNAVAIVRSAGEEARPAKPSQPQANMPQKSSFLRVLAALFASGTAAGASGQTTSDGRTDSASDDAPVTLPAFSVTAATTDAYRGTNTTAGSRISGNVMEVAGSISILTPEFIQDIAPARIFDATRYVAGVTEGQGDGFWDRQYIRGFQDNRASVDNFGSVQSENVEPLFIDHIEVIKGPSAILAPTGTPGGQINIIDKIPLYENSRTVSVELGRIDAQRVTVDLTGPFSPQSAAAYRVLAGYQDGELNTSGTRDRRKVVGAQFSYNLSPRTKLTVRGTYEDRWRFVYFPAYFDPETAVNGGEGNLAPGFDLTGSRNGTESWAHRGGYYYTTDALLTSSVGDHVSIRFAAKYQLNALRDAYMFGITPGLSDRYNPTTGVLTPNYTWALDPVTNQYVSTYSAYYDPTAVVRQPRKQDEDTTDLSAQLDVAFKYKFGGVSSTTVVGGVIGHGNDKADYYNGAQSTINLLAPVYGYTPSTWGSSIYSYHNTSDTDEQYVNEQVGFWNDRILAMAAVVRTGGSGTNSGVDSPYLSKTVPQYGLVVRALPNVSIYGGHSENTNPANLNGQQLWQDGKQDEVGVKTSFFHDRLSFSAAQFQITQTNISAANPAYQQDPLNQPQYLISDVKEHGTEFEVAGGLTKNLSVMGSVTLLHQRDSLGRRVIMVPDRAWALLLNYRFTDGPLKGLSAFIGTTYVSDRAGDIPSPAFTPLGVPTQVSYYLPALQLWSLGGKYTWNSHLTTSLNVDNLFDKKYVALSSGRFLGGVGTPLNIRLTTTLKF